jgi:hypothetical protein
MGADLAVERHAEPLDRRCSEARGWRRRNVYIPQSQVRWRWCRTSEGGKVRHCAAKEPVIVEYEANRSLKTGFAEFCQFQEIQYRLCAFVLCCKGESEVQGVNTRDWTSKVLTNSPGDEVPQ